MIRFDRRSTGPTKAQITAQIDAYALAFVLGKPLNRFVTIHCERAGVSSGVQNFLIRFIKHFGDWVRVHGETTNHHAWMIENPAGKGLHVHILFHVPDRLVDRFERLPPRWLEAAGGRNRKSAVRSESFYGINRGDASEDFFGVYGRDYLDEGVRGLAHYLSKGYRHDPGKHYSEFGAAFNDQGEVRGKRSGVSESLGASSLNRIFPPLASRRRPRLTASRVKALVLLREVFPREPILLNAYAYLDSLRALRPNAAHQNAPRAPNLATGGQKRVRTLTSARDRKRAAL